MDISIINTLVLKENNFVQEYSDNILNNPIEVKCYNIDGKDYYIDNNNIVYTMIPNILNLDLGKKIGYLKNKILFIDKKNDLNLSSVN